MQTPIYDSFVNVIKDFFKDIRYVNMTYFAMTDYECNFLIHCDVAK